MKKILIFLSMISFNLMSQNIEYPRIEKDSIGNKIVIMTVEQVQKIDNNLDILKLLEKSTLQCDSLNTAYIKVVDNLGKQIYLLELNVKTLKEQLNNKDKQISNLQEQLSNYNNINLLCEEQGKNSKEEIKILKKEIKRQKLQKFIGFAIGIAGVAGGIILVVI